MAPGPNDIRYVCLSDMHLGAELSLLTGLKNDPATGKPQVDPQVASPVLQELVYCLRELVSRNEDQTSKPTLILLGDILELALANDNMAAMVFERFIEKAMEPGYELFGKMIYIPGNHDHHLWESARETQYVRNYLPTTRPQDLLKIPWHTTNIFMDDDPNPPVPSFFLNGLLQRYDRLKNFNINTVYPNYGLRQSGRCVIFHHGHFVESIYLLMTTLKNLIFPEQKALTRRVWDLEAENFAWIDFFWSTLGRSGDFGKGVEIIYDKMQSEEQFRKLVENLATGMAEKYGISGTGLSGWLGSEITKAIVDGLVHNLVYPERTQTDQYLSQDARQGLLEYVNGALHLQIDEECTDRHLYFPQEVTFVFGHTHKPFEEIWEFRAYPGDGMPVYNTGGWVVETVDVTPLHGGAVVLLNENLNVVSLRMYNEANPVDVVNESLPAGRNHSDFFNYLKGLVQPDQPPWSKFSQTVVEELRLREEILQDKINS